MSCLHVARQSYRMAQNIPSTFNALFHLIDEAKGSSDTIHIRIPSHLYDSVNTGFSLAVEAVSKN